VSRLGDLDRRIISHDGTCDMSAALTVKSEFSRETQFVRQAPPVWLVREQAAPRRAELAHHLPPMSFAQDSGIFAEGDAARYFYKVVGGVVRSCRFSQDGRRHIDAFYKVGEMFGFELGEVHELSAEAVTDCVVIPLRRQGVELAGAQDETSAMQLYTYAMQSLTRARAHSQLLGRCSAVQKLASFLLELSADKQGQAIELPMTRQDIGDYLGLTIETVSRTLSQLEKDGAITLQAARRISIKSRAALADLKG